MADPDSTDHPRVRSIQWLRDLVTYWRDDIIENAKEAESALAMATRSKTGRAVVISIAEDYDEDLDEVAQRLKGDGDFVVAGVDGDDVVVFTSERATDAFLKWCDEHVEPD